ncbi:MAG: KpsF/GutQ family sugar-phosphate isomerase [Chitinophagaceae bacterium]
MDAKIIATAKQTIALEAAALQQIQEFIDNSFVHAVQTIHQSKGRLVITGIGKSAIIAQKIVSTLNSTGTPSLFMHAADAIHGDLGMVQKQDVVLVISKSGESPEIKVLVPLIKNFGNVLISITGNLNGYLALQSDIVLNTTVHQEACPNNLAPTTSTTAQLAMGDAIAVSLMELNGFKPQDFAKFHPGGNLGKRLFLKVGDLYSKTNVPKVSETAGFKEIINEISSKMLGATAVVTTNNEVVGIITDGDLRRNLEKTDDIYALLAKDIYTKNPKTIDEQTLAIDALEIMRNYDISQLVVVKNNIYQGILHLHQLVQEGII